MKIGLENVLPRYQWHSTAIFSKFTSGPKKIDAKIFSGQRKIASEDVKVHRKFQFDTMLNKDFIGVHEVGLEKKKKSRNNNNNNNNNKKKIQKAICREFSIYDENSKNNETFYMHC